MSGQSSYTNDKDAEFATTLPTGKTLRILAWIISVIFHPLFIPVYAGYYLAFLAPHFFSGYNSAQRFMIVLRIIINMVGFPFLTVMLLKAVGFIDSVLLRTQRDRIIPYIACGIFFFWLYLVFRNQPEIPVLMTSFVFGVFLASSAALIANIYYKISMHAIGCGGLTGLFLVMVYAYPPAVVTIPLIASILIGGLTCTARLIISGHSQKEIYMGLLVGLSFQYIAAIFLL